MALVSGGFNLFVSSASWSEEVSERDDFLFWPVTSWEGEGVEGGAGGGGGGGRGFFPPFYFFFAFLEVGGYQQLVAGSLHPQEEVVG